MSRRKRHLTDLEKAEILAKKQEKNFIKVGRFKVSDKKNTKPGEIHKIRAITEDHSEYHIYFKKNGERQPEWYSNALILGCIFKKSLKRNVDAFLPEEQYKETDYDWFCLGKKFQTQEDDGDWSVGNTKEEAVQNYMKKIVEEKQKENPLEQDEQKIKEKILEKLNSENVSEAIKTEDVKPEENNN